MEDDKGKGMENTIRIGPSDKHVHLHCTHSMIWAVIRIDFCHPRDLHGIILYLYCHVYAHFRKRWFLKPSQKSSFIIF